MKHRLNEDEVCIIKLNKKFIMELIKEEIFANYQDFGNISNRKVITSVYFGKEQNGDDYLLASFQKENLKSAMQKEPFAEKLELLNQKFLFSSEPKVLTKSVIEEVVK